jgi:GT2 family glycosyltransferase
VNRRDSSTPLVSILVVTYTQHERFDRCLSRIMAATCDMDVETIVVVNGVPLQEEHRRAEAAGATVVRSEVNLGLPGGMHYARHLARGRHLAIVQDDVEVGERWLEPLVAGLETDRSVGVIGCRVRRRDSRLDSDGMLVSRDGRALRLEPSGRTEPYWAVDATSSAACLVRGAAWDAIGGPNARLFPLFMVDVDLGLRMTSAGWTVLVARDSTARHEGSASSTSWLLRYLSERNVKMIERDHRAALRGRSSLFGDPAAIEQQLADCNAAARRRSGSAPAPTSGPPPVPVAHLARNARRDARRVRVGMAWFRVRSALGYRCRVVGRAARGRCA